MEAKSIWLWTVVLLTQTIHSIELARSETNQSMNLINHDVVHGEKWIQASINQSRKLEYNLNHNLNQGYELRPAALSAVREIDLKSKAMHFNYPITAIRFKEGNHPCSNPTPACDCMNEIEYSGMVINGIVSRIRPLLRK